MEKLRTVELARGLAAVSVVAFHTNPAAAHVGLAHSSWMEPFQYGVDFFFVLSGFIICHVHKADIGQPVAARPYLVKRFVRLFPMLWIVAGAWIALRTGMGKPPGLPQIGTSLLLYPSTVEPIPLVIWTLRHEVLFYLAFLLLIVSKRIGLAVLALWTVAVLYQCSRIAAGDPLEGVGSFLLSSYQLDFMLGVLVALVHERIRVRSWLPLLAGIVLVAGFAVATLHVDIGRHHTLDYTSIGNLYVPLNGLAFAVLLFGLLCIEDTVTVPRWGVLLGAASYSIYLVHTPVNSVVQHLAARLGNGPGHVAIFAAGIGVGIAAHLLVERRVTAFLRARLLGSRTAAGAA